MAKEFGHFFCYVGIILWDMGEVYFSLNTNHQIDENVGIKQVTHGSVEHFGCYECKREHQKPRYILDLLLSVINVSTQTVDIVRSLPRLRFE